MAKEAIALPRYLRLHIISVGTSGNSEMDWLCATLVEVWVGLAREALCREGCFSGHKTNCAGINRKYQINLSIQPHLDAKNIWAQ